MSDESNGKFTKRQKWLAGIAGPLLVVIIGWVGSYVGTTITAATRLAVVENRVSTLESQRKELIDAVWEIRDDVKDLKDKIDNLVIPAPDARITRMERKLDRIDAELHRAGPRNSASEQVRSNRDASLVCGENQLRIRAANGEYFCRRQ